MVYRCVCVWYVVVCVYDVGVCMYVCVVCVCGMCGACSCGMWWALHVIGRTEKQGLRNKLVLWLLLTLK